MNDAAVIVASALARKTGLVFSREQLAELEDFLRERFAALGLASAGDYLARLEEPEEFRAALDRLTVKETFFYRHEAQFDAFMKYLLPGFLDRAAGKRPVRLWSAGCCTGEEAYTLAILAAEAGCLERVEILATDIHEGYLEAAMAGAYSRRSVEKLPAEVLEKYFTREKDEFILNERIRSRVSFKYLNLGAPCFPSYLNGTSSLDAVFCRNVLIYFEKEKLREIILRFADCLAPGGVLALGHSEMLPRDWPLAAEMHGEAFFYKLRKAEAPKMPEAACSRPEGAVKAGQKTVKLPPSLPGAEEKKDLIEKAEKLADAGKASEAAALCRELIKGDSSLERAHYLLGLLELSRPQAALEHFRKTVYLNAGHLQARLHLAQCEERLGLVREAVREYGNLEKLAGARPAGEVFDAGEGITYGILALISRRALEKYR
ncbi:MAG: hypothetical protein PHV36_04510 [Elusimicrobiales bacterium]|nr:hypothetical protein [Elusimicrobiales bacterium]